MIVGMVILSGCTKSQVPKEKEEGKQPEKQKENPPYYFSFTVTKEEGDKLNTYTYISDFETKKIEENSEIPYTSQYPLTVYLDSTDEVYYTHREDGAGDDETYRKRCGSLEGERLTDSLFAVNYILPFADRVYLVAVENGTRAMGLFKFENGKICRILKDEDAFVWQVNYNPDLEKIVFNTYSQSEFDEKMANNMGEESFGVNTIYEMDLATESIRKVADVEEGYMTAIALDSSGDIYYQIGDWYKLKDEKSQKSSIFEGLQMDKLISMQNSKVYYISYESEIIGYDLETGEKELFYTLKEKNAAINNAVLLRR
ncbi:hypothetical protein ABXS75_07680 [Roseburia hominis]